MAPSTSKQSAASIDDPDHLRRFMEEMKKKRPTTFTSSQTQKTPSTTFDDAVTPVTEAASDKVDGSISPEKTSALVDPATPSGDSHFDVNGDHSVSSPLGGKTMVLPIRPKDNGMAPSDTMVNRFLQSPHLSGLKAPPPTPESGPHSSPLDPEEISGIIQISVESHLAGKKPMDGLAQSRHAPHVYASASSSPSQTKGILINADGYPRFKPPNRDLSPGSRREREASFDRISFAVADAPISSFLSRSEKAAHANYLAALEDRSSDKQPVLANGKDEVQPSTTNKARATSPAPLLGSHPNAPGTNIIDPRVPGQGLDLVSGTSNNQHSPKEVQKETHHKSVPKTFTDSSAATSVESAEATSATASVKNTTPLSNVSSGNETAISVPRNNGWIPPHLRLPGSSMGHRTTTSTNQSALEKSGKMADSDHILDPVHHEKVPTEDSWKIVASKQTAGPQYHETSSSKTFSISALNVQGIDMNASAHKGVRQPTPSNEAVNKQELPEGGCASSSKDTVSQSSSDQTFTKQDVISQTSDDTSKLPPHLRFLKSPADKLSGASSKGTVAHTSVTPIATVTANQEPSSINVGEGKHSSAKLPQPGSSLEAAKPSSVEALYVSPNTGSTTPSITAAGAITAANNDLENTVFLGAWPKRGEREASAARIRKVIITGLPSGSTATFVASLVYGGPIENISVGSSSASVLFLHAQDCLKYYNATKNGVVYGKDGERELFAIVDLGKDVDVIGGMLQSLIELKATRCVKVNGADEKFTKAELVELANSKHRRLEGIEDGKGVGPNGKERREITFRFCCIQDAVTFTAWLRREEEWEDLGIFHSPDPCAKATGVHFD